ncbi:MAG: dUTP diphosphatase [Desulfobacteraceae bacterium]|nr:dUTP diphosphatase [Desulfobacteraceae bacterium]
MILKITKVNSEAILPRYAHDDDSGLDLFSMENHLLEPGKFKLIKTGIKIELPGNTEAQVRPRSGLASKYGISVLNTPGTIDEGYRGEIGIILINHSHLDFEITKGMKVAQMVIAPVLRPRIVEVSTLSDTQRGDCGFGSTGHQPD